MGIPLSSKIIELSFRVPKVKLTVGLSSGVEGGADGADAGGTGGGGTHGRPGK